MAPRPSPGSDRLAEPFPVAELLSEVLRRTHLSAPSGLTDVLSEQAAAFGAHDLELLMIDLPQTTLVPLHVPDGGAGEPLSVAGTVAGRAYSGSTILESPRTDGQRRRFWFPLLDGTERMGVLGVSFDPDDVDDDVIVAMERFAHLAATLIVTKSAYGDRFDVARRRRPMTIAAELVWALVPPLVFATDGLVLAGILEPCYDNGGDALDYAVNDGVLHVAVFDAMGHGLPAAGVVAFALSAYRHSRRRGCDLVETYASMDAAVADQFPDDRFVTAVIAQLDLATGRLTWVSAGHPPPLLIRGGRHARILDASPATPLGVLGSGSVPEVAEEALEPGDMLLLYTDGLTEARTAEGGRLEVEGLSAFVEREASAGHAAPETLRRLRQSLVSDDPGGLEDDATALLIEWRRDAERRLLPPTAGRPHPGVDFT